jgi:hypothetical protein
MGGIVATAPGGRGGVRWGGVGGAAHDRGLERGHQQLVDDPPGVQPVHQRLARLMMMTMMMMAMARARAHGRQSVAAQWHRQGTADS